PPAEKCVRENGVQQQVDAGAETELLGEKNPPGGHGFGTAPVTQLHRNPESESRTGDAGDRAAWAKAALKKNTVDEQSHQKACGDKRQVTESVRRSHQVRANRFSSPRTRPRLSLRAAE